MFRYSDGNSLNRTVLFWIPTVPGFEPEILCNRSTTDVYIAPQLQSALENSIHVEKFSFQMMTLTGVKKLCSTNQVLELANTQFGHDAANLWKDF